MRRYYGQPQRNEFPKCCMCAILAGVVILTVCTLPLLIMKYEIPDFSTLLMEQVDEAEIAKAYEIFVKDFDKKYPNAEEEQLRKSIFTKNYKRIVSINKQQNSFQLGVNKFADLTQEEFRKKHLARSEPVEFSAFSLFSTPSGINEDEEKDWEKEGFVSPIKDQGNCGSCWTFSSISAMESLYAIKNAVKPPSLSEQQLVDCCKTDLSDGCNGGERWEAFLHVKNNGIALGADYPYLAYNSNCKSNVKKLFNLDDYKNISRGNTTELVNALKTRPVSIGVNASPFVFMFYKKGIIDKYCPSDEINHGVVAVGFGKDKDTGKLFWKVRNSWGKNWGDNGYVYIERQIEDGPGLCAIAMKGCMPKYKD